MGINDRVQLSEAEKLMRKRINEKVMREGVTLIDPEGTYFEAGVVIGNDTVVYPGNVFSGDTVIGSNCTIYPNNRIDNAKIADGCVIEGAVILSSEIGENTKVGPNAYIRPESVIGKNITESFAVRTVTISGGSFLLGRGAAVYVVTEGCGSIVAEGYNREIKKGDYFLMPDAAKGIFSVVGEKIKITECYS